MTVNKPPVIDLVAHAQEVGTSLRDAVREGHSLLKDMGAARRELTTTVVTAARLLKEITDRTELILEAAAVLERFEDNEGPWPNVEQTIEDGLLLYEMMPTIDKSLTTCINLLDEVLAVSRFIGKSDTLHAILSEAEGHSPEGLLEALKLWEADHEAEIEAAEQACPHPRRRRRS